MQSKSEESGSLRDLMAADAAMMCDRTDDFAEEVTYTPNGGTARCINVVADSVTMAEPRDELGNYRQVERLTVVAKRDATKGIDSPASGDQIVRDSAIEPDTRPYLFSGEITERESQVWTLIFQRYKTRDQGAKR